MKTFIANFALPALAMLTTCVICDIPGGLHPNTRIFFPISFSLFAWVLSQYHERLK